MKLAFVYVQSGREAWAEQAIQVYTDKIKGFMPFDVYALKSKAVGRVRAHEKTKAEQNKLLEFFNSDDLVILFDEKGRQFKGSIEFSDFVSRALESGKKRIVFAIGGAFGFGDEVRQRADAKVSLSALTMSHLVAQVVALEQLYRALTIRKGIPYHNE